MVKQVFNDLVDTSVYRANVYFAVDPYCLHNQLLSVLISVYELKNESYLC